MKGNKETPSRKGRESIRTCAKCLLCLGNKRESNVDRLSGVWAEVVKKKASKLNWVNLVYAL